MREICIRITKFAGKSTLWPMEKKGPRKSSTDTTNDNDMFFLFTDSHDVLFDKRMIWFSAYTVNLFTKAYHRITYILYKSAVSLRWYMLFFVVLALMCFLQLTAQKAFPGGTPYLKWQVCAYSKSKVGAYQVKCVLSKIWGHAVNNPSKNQAIPYQVQ